MTRIGLVAGEGRLPIVFSQVARDKGDAVVAFALRGVTSDDLANYVDKIHWLEWGNWQKALLLLAAERIKKIIMLGKLKKETLFKNKAGLDEEAKRIMDRLNDKKDYSVLNEVTRLLNKAGIEVIDSTTYLKDLIPQKGILTKREPTEGEWVDINYGRTIAKSLSGYDIGQTLAIKDRTIIAVEAMEGTDETIARAGTLVRGGFIVIKVARPNQDMRFDVPLAGPHTLNAIIQAGGKILALEAGATLLLDKEEAVRVADENGISIAVI